jgi:hypothetical protein
VTLPVSAGWLAALRLAASAIPRACGGVSGMLSIL